jgi:hypothetical protein
MWARELAYARAEDRYWALRAMMGKKRAGSDREKEEWKRTQKLWKTVVRTRGRGRDADAPAGRPIGPNPDPSPTDEDYYDEADDNDYNNDDNIEDNEEEMT